MITDSQVGVGPCVDESGTPYSVSFRYPRNHGVLLVSLLLSLLLSFLLSLRNSLCSVTCASRVRVSIHCSESPPRGSVTRFLVLYHVERASALNVVLSVIDASPTVDWNCVCTELLGLLHAYEDLSCERCCGKRHGTGGPRL